MENVIKTLFIVLISILIVNEVWRMKFAIKREARSEKLDILLSLKLMKELGIKSLDDLD